MEGRSYGLFHDSTSAFFCGGGGSGLTHNIRYPADSKLGTVT